MSELSKIGERVRRMRTELKEQGERAAYVHGSPSKVFHDGRVRGMTDVLELLVPNPQSDEPAR